MRTGLLQTPCAQESAQPARAGPHPPGDSLACAAAAFPAPQVQGLQVQGALQPHAARAMGGP